MQTVEHALDDAALHHQAGLIDLAKEAYKRILDTDPYQLAALIRLGQSLFALGCFKEAEQALRRATELFPDDAAVNRELGTFLALQNRYSEAEELYTRAIDLDSDDVDAYKQWGNIRFLLARFDKAIEALSHFVQSKPEDLNARTTLSIATCKLARFGDHLEAVKDFIRPDLPLDSPEFGFVMTLFLNPEIGTSDTNRLISEMFQYLNRNETAPAPIPVRTGRKKITLGYLTAHLHHTNYLGFLDKVIKTHDRDRFVVNTYTDSSSTDSGENVCGTKNLSNDELCEKIRADRVDILIDLNGFASIDRMGLLAMKPCPVIASWFNTFSTLGLNSVDYLIGDDVVTPPEEDRLYRENIYRVPGCYLLRHIDEDAPPVRQAPIGRNGYCTFGSLATDHKISIESIAIWAKLLNTVPDSKFILRNAEINEYLSQFYLDEFVTNGVEPSRIKLLGEAPHAQFLETYDLIDIGLDTFPGNGGTTTAEALWQGVPVVTFQGERWVSRIGATILNAIGRPEWVGEDLDEYVEIAAALAQRPENLEEMRRGQREKIASSIFCDSAGFTRKLETAYEHMAREKRIIQ